MPRCRYGCWVAICIGSFAGCATVIHGPNQTVTITSDPPGATITVLSGGSGGSSVVRTRPGLTPLQVSLPRRDPHLVIRLEKGGCAPAEIVVKRSVSGWTYSNLLFANPLALQGASGSNSESAQYAAQLASTAGALLVDVASGGAFNLPPWVHASLCATTTEPGRTAGR